MCFLWNTARDMCRCQDRRSLWMRDFRRCSTLRRRYSCLSRFRIFWWLASMSGRKRMTCLKHTFFQRCISSSSGHNNRRNTANWPSRYMSQVSVPRLRRHPRPGTRQRSSGPCRQGTCMNLWSCRVIAPERRRMTWCQLPGSYCWGKPPYTCRFRQKALPPDTRSP